LLLKQCLIASIPVLTASDFIARSDEASSPTLFQSNGLLILAAALTSILLMIGAGFASLVLDSSKKSKVRIAIGSSCIIVLVFIATSVWAILSGESWVAMAVLLSSLLAGG